MSKKYKLQKLIRFFSFTLYVLRFALVCYAQTNAVPLRLEAAGEKSKNLNSQLESKTRALYLNTQKSQAIKKDFERLKELAELYQELGTTYIKTGDFSLAIDAYKKSLKANPDNTYLYYCLGLLYKHANNSNQEAILNFKKYLKRNPEAKNKKEVVDLITMLKHSKQNRLQ